MTTTDPLAVTDEMVAVFKQAWELADASGLAGYRSRAGLEAVAPLLREQTLAPIRALADEWERRGWETLDASVSVACSSAARHLRAALGDPT